MNNKRKNRGGSVRPPRVRSVSADGVYNNAHFMHAATSHVGNMVQIHTQSGSVWEGVFRTFSSNFEVVLEVATRVEKGSGTGASTVDVGSYVDKLIFKACDIISIVARNVDLDYATRDTFQTDTAISRFNGQARGGEERELEPWDGSGGVNGDETSLELEPGANGWDAADMFRKNEQVYGVQSTYDQTLAGYTLPLQRKDTAEFREAEAKADIIAQEIESQPSYKARLDLENGDEEERFAAVIRPSDTPNTPSPTQNNSPNIPLNSNQQSAKYVPPAKRKNNPTTGKVMRSTPPPPAPSQQLPPQQQPPPTPPQPQIISPQQPMPSQPVPVASAIVQQQQQPLPKQGYAYPAPPMVRPPPVPASVPLQQPPQARIPMINVKSYSKNVTPPLVKAQVNGEAKPLPQRTGGRGQPGGYPPPNMPNFQEPPPPKPQPPPQEQRVPRHREDTVQELRKFSQDFKLVPSHPQAAPAEPPVAEIPVVNKPVPPHDTSPPSININDNVGKMSDALKKSKLNPNAKEFIFNPSAKPFTPRSPSTPSASRPHTPQTPSPYMPTGAQQTGMPQGQPPMPMVMPTYMVSSQPTYQPQPHTQSNRLRKVQMGNMRADMASQMQVAAATGQPLLAPAPLQQFVYPPGGLTPQAYQQMHTMRMYHHESPPHTQLQYLPAAPSNAPSPAAGGGPGPQYGGGGGPVPPPQGYPGAAGQPPHHQFPILLPMPPPPPPTHMVPNVQYLQQPHTGHTPHHIQIGLKQDHQHTPGQAQHYHQYVHHPLHAKPFLIAHPHSN